MPAGTRLASRKPRRAANSDTVTYEPCLLGIRGHVVHRVPNGLEVGDRLVRILTPNISSACTAISTMASESTSKSSSKDFSTVTLSATQWP